MPFHAFRRDHSRSTSGIICGSGSFAVHFEDHFRSRDHLRLGIIPGLGIICGRGSFAALYMPGSETERGGYQQPPSMDINTATTLDSFGLLDLPF